MSVMYAGYLVRPDSGSYNIYSTYKYACLWGMQVTSCTQSRDHTTFSLPINMQVTLCAQSQDHTPSSPHSAAFPTPLLSLVSLLGALDHWFQHLQKISISIFSSFLNDMTHLVSSPMTLSIFKSKLESFPRMVISD